MFTVYAEKNIFESIILGEINTPNWETIFRKHADICLNISDEELIAESMQGTPIFEFIMLNGGRSPIALADFFECIYEDTSLISQKPRAAFFLNIEKSVANDLQSKFGVIVQGEENIDDEILNTHFKKVLEKGRNVSSNGKHGWKSVLKFPFPPSNALVLSDPYLMTANEKVGGDSKYAGVENLVMLLDSILPVDLNIDYHITIIAEDGNRDDNWRSKVSHLLINELKALRPYQLVVELVFVKHEDLHERIMIMNYINTTCDHGFYVFKVRDGKTVHVRNKISVNGHFCNVKNILGDVEYDISENELISIKRICDKLSNHLSEQKNSYIGDIKGHHNPDYTIINRLLNDI